MNRNQRSTKHDPSYWEYVDALHYVQNSNSSVKHNASSSYHPIPRRTMPMLDQFQPFIHDFIDNIVDVKVDRLITIVSCFFCMNVEKRNSWKGTGLHLKVSKTLLLYLANSFSSGVRISTKYLLYERIC